MILALATYHLNESTPTLSTIETALTDWHDVLANLEEFEQSFSDEEAQTEVLGVMKNNWLYTFEDLANEEYAESNEFLAELGNWY